MTSSSSVVEVRCGGVVGYCSSKTLFAFCSNAGTIFANTQYGSSPGGIVSGTADDYGCNIVSCHNSGTIVGFLVGGIIADLKKNGVVMNCFNEGNCVSTGNGDTDVAGAIKLVIGDIEMKNVYNLNEDTPVISQTWNNGTTIPTQVIENCYGVNGKAIVQNNNNSVDLSTCKTFDPTSLKFSDNTTLVDALNAWVEENIDEYPELKYWEEGDDGYPVFVE